MKHILSLFTLMFLLGCTTSNVDAIEWYGSRSPI